MYHNLALLCLVAASRSAAMAMSVNSRAESASLPPYTLPMNDPDPAARAANITYKRANFIYGPAIGGGPFFPAGSLGNTTAADDNASLEADLADLAPSWNADEAAAVAAASNYDGLTTLEDYTKLYAGEWAKTAPTGVVPGMLTNYTQDLLFSMERLSLNPYSVRRLDPSTDPLPFTLESGIAENLTTLSQDALYSGGRLFYVDHSSQNNLTRTNKSSAACDAMFYIHPDGSFLPLAIRTNVGSSLIYTPLDAPEDWLLAKMMFNVNDFWMGQWYHLANTHEVIEIVYEAAIRTLGEDHPVLAILQRLAYQAFSFRQQAAVTLFAPGAVVDQYYPFSGASAESYTTSLYESGEAGNWVSNYFETNLKNRGLIDSSIGPALTSFPFYDDASAIYKQLNAFMSSFVDSYYTNSTLLAEDTEIQAWLKEAGPAKILDFPSPPLSDSTTLVDMLTHFAFLVSVSHHAVNTNELITASSTLPFHPVSLYQAIPTQKGVTNVVPFLPPLEAAIAQIFVGANFARLEFANSNRTLVNMFDDSDLLSRMNSATVSAATTFQKAMVAFSSKVNSRSFDSAGLSQGMPFIWKALDPNVVPFAMAV